MSGWHDSVIAATLRDVCNVSAIDLKVNGNIPPEVGCPRNDKTARTLQTRRRSGFRARFWFGRGLLLHCSFRRRRTFPLRQLFFLRWRWRWGWRRRGLFFWFHNGRGQTMRHAQEQHHDGEETKCPAEHRDTTAQITPRCNVGLQRCNRKWPFSRHPQKTTQTIPVSTECSSALIQPCSSLRAGFSHPKSR